MIAYASLSKRLPSSFLLSDEEDHVLPIFWVNTQFCVPRVKRIDLMPTLSTKDNTNATARVGYTEKASVAHAGRWHLLIEFFCRLPS